MFTSVYCLRLVCYFCIVCLQVWQPQPVAGMHACCKDNAFGLKNHRFDVLFSCYCREKKVEARRASVFFL